MIEYIQHAYFAAVRGEWQLALFGLGLASALIGVLARVAELRRR